MKILILFDKFKGCLTSAQACAIAREEVQQLFPSAQVEAKPTSDGGDGFCDLLTAAVDGVFETMEVVGPRGGSLTAKLGYVNGSRLSPAVWHVLRLAPCARVAVLEMAQASGLAPLAPAERDPWYATSYGTGQMLVEAARGGADAIVLGMGGSATNDCGLGALAALGLRAPESSDRSPAGFAPCHWQSLSAFSEDALLELPPLRIACDVDNPLLGAEGATAIFARQKGMRPSDHARTESAMERVSEILCRHFNRSLESRQLPGSGAAGGIAFGLGCAYGAELVSGFDLVGAWLELEEKIATADLVITGEGCFDLSSMQGKGPGAIVRRVLNRGGMVSVFAGSIGEELRLQYSGTAGLQLVGISPAELSLEQAMSQAESLLRLSLREHLRPRFLPR